VLLAFVVDADVFFAMISENVVRLAMIGCCNFHLEPSIRLAALNAFVSSIMFSLPVFVPSDSNTSGDVLDN
jgi:hypothetical protein